MCSGFDRYNDSYQCISFNLYVVFYLSCCCFFEEIYQKSENLFVFGSTVLPDPSISTQFCFDSYSNTFLCTAMPWYATTLTTVIKYALSHSIGINVAVVGLTSHCLILCYFPCISLFHNPNASLTDCPCLL